MEDELIEMLKGFVIATLSRVATKEITQRIENWREKKKKEKQMPLDGQLSK